MLCPFLVRGARLEAGVFMASGEKRNIVQQCANGIWGEGTQLGHRKIDPDSERISQLRGIAEARGGGMLVLRSKSILTIYNSLW